MSKPLANASVDSKVAADLLVFGPRTRLAQAVLRAPWVQAYRPWLAARDAREQAWCEQNHPGARVLPLWQAPAALPRVSGALAICVCAAGPVHPQAPALSADLATVQRDLEAVTQLIEQHHTATVHVVFISTVLAWAPRTARAYYAGWKNVIEGALEPLAQDGRRRQLSVFYPGRLVDAKRCWKPPEALYTTFDQLAVRIGRRLAVGRASRRVVGWDARLWLLARALRWRR